MSDEMLVLTSTAAAIGFFHTLIGPDHYLPFIVIARARKWSLLKTTFVTFVCGVGHVASSVLLGFAGIALGIVVTEVAAVESFRANIAAWMLITFGVLYFIWGLKRAAQTKPHKHIHGHFGGVVHDHSHIHSKDHLHPHKKGDKQVTPWILFTIFVFGPCEPLVPVLMYPAAKNSLSGVFIVAAAFGIVTIMTMCLVVLISSYGMKFIDLGRVERFNHSIAGATICISGLAINYIGI